MGKLFYVGQVVICINDDFKRTQEDFPSIHYPIFARRYVIRDYIATGLKQHFVVLQEIRNPNVMYYDGFFREPSFWEGRFVAAPPPAKKTTIVEREEELA